MARSFPTFFSFISLPFGTSATSEGPAQFAYSGKSLDFTNIGKIVIVTLSGFKHRRVLCSNPLILEWVAISSSRGFSQPRDRIRVSCISCIGKGLFITRATWQPMQYSGSMCICQSQTPNLFLPQHFPFGNYKFVFFFFPPINLFSKSVSLFQFCK